MNVTFMSTNDLIDSIENSDVDWRAGHVDGDVASMLSELESRNTITARAYLDGSVGTPRRAVPASGDFRLAH